MVVSLAIICPPAGLAAGAIYTTIDVAGAVKGADLISGRKLSDKERLTRGAFAIVPGAGGLAVKSLLKHMPALGTVMKTVSKTMDDAVKPIKTTVEHLTITGKQAVKTIVAKTQQQVSKANDSVKLVKQSMGTAINRTLEHAKQLGKVHVDQLKFALTHPIIATVTSKEGQKSIRGTASIIDDAKRPIYIKNMEVVGGPKIPVGIERGPSEDVFKNKGEDLISRMQAEKDALKGTKATGKSASTLNTKLEKYVCDSFEGTGKGAQDNFNKYLRENVWCDETLSNSEKIEIMKENFNRLTAEQKIDFNVLSDEKFISHNSDYTNWGDWPPVNWPEFPGLDKTQSIISISKEYPIPEKLDRIGSLYGNNFSYIPNNGIKYTMEQRAICYIDNPAAYHKYTFKSTHYIDCIDCIKNKDVDRLNKIIDEMNFKNIDSHIEHIDENDMIDWNLQYNKFQNNTLLKALCEEKGLDSTYGLLGKAAPWYDEGKNKLLANGGAGQLNTPVSGNVLKYLGVLREE